MFAFAIAMMQLALLAFLFPWVVGPIFIVALIGCLWQVMAPVH